MKTHCKELGASHSSQVRYPFAPGVIEGPPQSDSAGLPVVEAVLVLVCVAAVVAVVGFVCGYFSVPGVLL